MQVYHFRRFLFLALSAVILLAAWSVILFSAPVPIKKPKPAPIREFLHPGDYDLKWGGYSEPMVLGKIDKKNPPAKVLIPPENSDYILGTYKWGRVWYGSYAWSKSGRIFSVIETTSGTGWMHWWVVLDKDGKGEVQGDFQGTSIVITFQPDPEKLKIMPKVND
jgi:hypothetical protein